ncbi:hypothetical protein [Pelagerythrobacter rhizovicinus]|uniref:hypothetical protein n=1 Tax=Pelagerythrobacter rhizovicinus TaxID=2268576 RepID=UPI001013A172|nr:hypothetical protein [Pelagerythrobacter rhizovicinus]
MPECPAAGTAGLQKGALSGEILVVATKLQSGLLDDLKDAYCSLPSFGGGVTGSGYAGLGGGVTGEIAFDPNTGRISISGGLNVGVGIGFSTAVTCNAGRGVSSDRVPDIQVILPVHSGCSADFTSSDAKVQQLRHGNLRPQDRALRKGVRSRSAGQMPRLRRADASSSAENY